MLLQAAKRRRLTSKQPPPGVLPPAAVANAVSQEDRNSLRTCIRDRWIANHLARAGLQGRKERDCARSLFHVAEDKAELLQELRDAGRILNRLLPAVPSLLAEWASVRLVMHGREGETLVPTPYRGTGSMFRYSGPWSRLEDDRLVQLLVAQGEAATGDVAMGVVYGSSPVHRLFGRSFVVW